MRCLQTLPASKAIRRLMTRLFTQKRIHLSKIKVSLATVSFGSKLFMLNELNSTYDMRIKCSGCDLQPN
jgi:hypothetical protein